MLTAKKLQKICFFLLLVTWVSLCLTNIYTSLDIVNTSLNVVTESLIPFKQALCMKYTDSTLYSTNGKLLFKNIHKMYLLYFSYIFSHILCEAS